MAKHHKYGGSTSSRWLNCPGSTQYIHKLKDQGKIPKISTSNIYSETGTVAHALGEICLIKKYDIKIFYGKTIPEVIGKKECSKYLDQKELKFIDISKEIINEEYIQAVTTYINYAKESTDKDSIVFVEGRFELTDYVGADCGGSSDLSIIHPKRKLLHVIDYKNGKGLVNVNGNTQMREYGLGIYRKYKNKYDLKNIQITIVQPRGDHSQGPIRSEDFSIRYLIQWGSKVLKLAIKL